MTQPGTKAKRGARPETAWEGKVARWYDSLVKETGSGFQSQVIFPHALRLLQLEKGQHLLDLACGQGAFCRTADKLGVHVTGLDASADLIGIARQRSSRSVRYVVGDATRLGRMFPANSFDAAACLLAIQNIDPMEPVFSACGQVLRPGGRLVVVMTHPCFRIPRQSSWGWDEGRKLLFRRVDLYLSSLKIPIQTHPGADPGIVTHTFHRPLQRYIQAIAQAGLWIDTLEEWPSPRVSKPGARAKAENRARAEIPLFLALRAVKFGAGSVASRLGPPEVPASHQ